MLTSVTYAPQLLLQFPALHAFIGFIDGVTPQADINATVSENLSEARFRLAEAGTESQLESVQQWRSAYRQVGTDPTKFRMAAESILRRLRTNKEFTTSLHPLVVLCNSFSARFAVPVAALDVEHIDGRLSVRPASGGTVYAGFDGTTVVVPEGEVTFEDEAGHAHARKWSHKQSALSAVSPQTTRAFLIAESLNGNAKAELGHLAGELQRAVRQSWPNATYAGCVLSGDELSAEVPWPFAAEPDITTP